MVHFSECSTVAANCNTETQIEMRDETVKHIPEGGFERAKVFRVDDGIPGEAGVVEEAAGALGVSIH